MKKSKILTPVLTGLALASAAAPAVILTGCGCNNSGKVQNSIKTITQKLDCKPDDGKVTITIEKKDGLDVEFVTAPGTTNDAKTTITVDVNDKNEFTVYVKFQRAPTTTGTSTFNLNTKCVSGGAEKTQVFENNKIEYDISRDFVEIKDGYSPKITPPTDLTKQNFIQKYVAEILKTDGDIFRDDLYTSCYINLKKIIDAGGFEGLQSYKICLNDLVSIQGKTDMFKLHLNFYVKADKLYTNKITTKAPSMIVNDLEVNVSLECVCYWVAADAGQTQGDYPVLKAVAVAGTGAPTLDGKITGSFKVEGVETPFNFKEVNTTSDIDPFNPQYQDFVSVGLALILFGEEIYQETVTPKWVSPYCRNVK